jgi:ROS/MUCR transcriptional regulator protein
MGEEGEAMKRVDAATLEQMRQNPATAVQGDKVVCLECGLLMRQLTRSPNSHARRIHKLDAAAYLAKWPGAPLQTGEAKQDELNKHYAYLKANRPAMNKQRRAHAATIREIAESNPTSPEAARLKKEHDRRADSWKEKYHGDGPGDKAAEAFQKSESKRRHDRHEDNKEQENKQGRNRYHDNLPVSRAKSREKQTNMRLRASQRPADWLEKPTDWRVIGTELLSKESMSNKELAARLDASRLVTCPSRYGENWKAAVKEESCEKFINRIRGWVKRPGRVAESKLAVN